MMTEYDLNASPGLWRRGALWVRNDKTGQVVYEAPDAEDVPELVEELVEQLYAEGNLPPMIRAAMAHLNLVMIHPFRDGNGRMARCLQTLVLARDRVLAPEFCNIEEYLGTNTDEYYQVLAQVGQAAWNPGNDVRPWIRFCLVAHFVQATSVLRRVQESERVWTELEGLISGHRLPVRSIAALFDAVIGLRIRNASYRTALRQWDEEVSNQVATIDLRAMVRAGLLDQRGQKRGTYYVAAGPLREIRSRRLAGHQDVDTSQLFEPGVTRTDPTAGEP